MQRVDTEFTANFSVHSYISVIVSTPVVILRFPIIKFMTENNSQYGCISPPSLLLFQEYKLVIEMLFAIYPLS